MQSLFYNIYAQKFAFYFVIPDKTAFFATFKRLYSANRLIPCENHNKKAIFALYNVNINFS